MDAMITYKLIRGVIVFVGSLGMAAYSTVVDDNLVAKRLNSYGHYTAGPLGLILTH